MSVYSKRYDEPINPRGWRVILDEDWEALTDEERIEEIIPYLLNYLEIRAILWDTPKDMRAHRERSAFMFNIGNHLDFIIRLLKSRVEGVDKIGIYLEEAGFKVKDFLPSQ